MKDSHRKCCQRCRMTLVDMVPTTQRHDFTSAERPRYYRAFMSDNGCLGKTGNVGERNAHRITDFLGKSAQSGAKYDGDGWLRVAAGSNRLCRERRGLC